jgi:hypothetical protein
LRGGKETVAKKKSFQKENLLDIIVIVKAIRENIVANKLHRSALQNGCQGVEAEHFVMGYFLPALNWHATICMRIRQ